MSPHRHVVLCVLLITSFLSVPSRNSWALQDSAFDLNIGGVRLGEPRRTILKMLGHPDPAIWNPRPREAILSWATPSITGRRSIVRQVEFDEHSDTSIVVFGYNLRLRERLLFSKGDPVSLVYAVLGKPNQSCINCKGIGYLYKAGRVLVYLDNSGTDVCTIVLAAPHSWWPPEPRCTLHNNH